MTVLGVYTSFQLVFWGSAKKNSLWALNFSLFFHNSFCLFSLLILGFKKPTYSDNDSRVNNLGLIPGSATY